MQNTRVRIRDARPKLLLFILVCPNYVQAGLPLTEGEWEIRSKIEISGITTNQPPHLTTMCLSQTNRVPWHPPNDQTCTTSNRVLKMNSLSWTMKCRSTTDDLIYYGKFVYKGKTLEGSVRVEGAQKISYVYTINGKYLKSCNGLHPNSKSSPYP